jgi:tetratricopeptide (TPR) repeat protein
MIGAYLQSRYRIEAELGQGGMGAIYRATDTLLQREVAVKVLSASGLGTEGRARLLREAQAVAKLNHPNIVSVYDAGESDGAPFIVMELVTGESLRERPPKSIEEALSITRQLCDALDHAHKNGVVHRDLKPENVIITSDGVAKLVDFGLARSGTTRASIEGTLVGTVFYLAPEQALGKEIDARADLYALGVMLYELTTNRLPFTADDPIAVISQHLYAPVVPPSTFSTAIPPALDALIVRLMSKQPHDRPVSASAVKQAIDSLRLARTDIAPLVKPDGLSLLDRIVRGRLVARQAELAQLIELWSHAQQEGHSHLVLISGEPGVGKTRLAHELMVYAQMNGALVLRGGCYEFEAATPYMPLAEALRDWVSGQKAEDLHARLGSNAYELARLAPEIEVKIGPLPPNPPLPPNDERLRLFDHVARFLQMVATEHGLLLFIDDLHWADHGTIALLHYVLHRLRNDRALVLAAYREIELDRSRPLADALVDWNRERLATRVPIGRLPPDGTCSMLCALLGLNEVTDEFAELIHRETEGNPFFVEEVVKSLIEQGQIYRAGDHWERKELGELTVPQSVREAIGRRLNRLSQSCVDVLHLAAVLGKSFVFNELAAVGTIAEEHVLDALDEAEHAQLIRAERTEEFHFTHDKIREVLYEEVNPIRRRRLHQRIGESLLQLYAGSLDTHVADLAYHFAESGDLEKGLEFCTRAAEKSEAVFAHDEALGYTERAVACAEGLNLPEHIAALEQGAGDICYWRGPFEQAIEHYQHALTHTKAIDQRAALKTKIGATYAYMGDERGLEFLLAAEQELDPAVQADDLARTLAMLGRYHHYRQDSARAIDYLERARQLAEPLNQVRTITEIYLYLAGACQSSGRFECSDDWAQQLIALGERENYAYAVAMGHECLAENANARGYWQAALDHAARTREIGEKIGSLARVAWAESSVMHAHHVHGDLTAALAAGNRCVTLAERIGDLRLTVQARSARANIHCDLNDDTAAQVDLDAALGGALKINQRQALNWAYWAMIRFQVLHEEWERVLETADEMTTRLDNEPIGYRIAAYYWLQRCDDLARLMAANPLQIDPNWALRFQGDTAWSMGTVEARIGSPEKAHAAYSLAAEIYEQLGMRLELGRVLTYRARLWREQGAEGAAQADLLRARSICAECGAVRDAANIQQLIDEGP